MGLAVEIADLRGNLRMAATQVTYRDFSMTDSNKLGIKLDAQAAFLFTLPDCRHVWELLEHTFAEDRNRLERAIDTVFRTFCPVAVELRTMAGSDGQYRVALRLRFRLGIIHVGVTAASAADVFTVASRSPCTRIGEMQRRNEVMLSLAYFATRDIAWDWDIESDVMHVSPRLAELLGYAQPGRYIEQVGFASLFHPEDVESERIARQRHVSEHARYDVEYRLRNVAGEYRWFRSVGETLLDEDGKPLHMAGVISDIDALKFAERQLIEQRNELGTTLDQLQDVSKRLIRAQEDERRHIARELHDQTGQTLTAAILDLEFWRGRPVPTEEIDRMLTEVKRALGEIRDISLRLRPPLLDEAGLEIALRAYLDRQAAAAKFSVSFVTEGLSQRQPAEVDITAFRLVQEAVTNIVRHAQARHVDVNLSVTSAELTLRISDDGAGCVAPNVLSNAVSGTSLGLVSMQERAALLGGKCEFISMRGVGSIVLVRIPLSRTE